MDVGRLESRSHTFVVRVWLERAGREAVWRGHITHVTTEDREHFGEPAEILSFIRKHMTADGAPPDPPAYP